MNHFAPTRLPLQNKTGHFSHGTDGYIPGSVWAILTAGYISSCEPKNPGQILITMTSQWAPWRLKSPPPISNVWSGADQRKHQSSAPLAFVRGIPSQRASNAENAFIWWRHHGMLCSTVQNNNRVIGNPQKQASLCFTSTFDILNHPT